MDPEDRTLARLHDTTQDRGPELEAHWSHAPLRAACVLRLALGTLLYYTLLNSRRFAFLCLIQLLHLRARRRRPLHCGTVSRASRHTGLIGSHLASQHSAFLSSHPMSSLAPTHLVYILSYVSCPHHDASVDQRPGLRQIPHLVPYLSRITLIPRACTALCTLYVYASAFWLLAWECGSVVGQDSGFFARKGPLYGLLMLLSLNTPLQCQVCPPSARHFARRRCRLTVRRSSSIADVG